MDSRFTVTAHPRLVPPGLTAETPPVSLAWRAMEAWQRELKKCQQEVGAAEQQARTAWIALADEHYRLTRLVQRATPSLEQAGLAREAEDFRLMVRRLEHVLQQEGVTSLAPVGAPYTIEMSDALLNLEQQISQTLQVPTVLEVIEPIVMQHGEVIRPGKAIIAVPAPARQC